MAGSFAHVTDLQGRFTGIDRIENLGDALEALEEMYGMIWWLAQHAADKNTDRSPEKAVQIARQNWERGIEMSPGVVDDGD